MFKPVLAKLYNVHILFSIFLLNTVISLQAPTENHLGEWAAWVSIIYYYYYYNHKKSFRDPEHGKDTVLSNYIWKLKNDARQFSVKWSILKRASAYKSDVKRCNLCLEEKLCIMKADKKHLLNKRAEIFSKCRHKNKHKICNMKP